MARDIRSTDRPVRPSRGDEPQHRERAEAEEPGEARLAHRREHEPRQPADGHRGEVGATDEAVHPAVAVVEAAPELERAHDERQAARHDVGVERRLHGRRTAVVVAGDARSRVGELRE